MRNGPVHRACAIFPLEPTKTSNALSFSRALSSSLASLSSPISRSPATLSSNHSNSIVALLWLIDITSSVVRYRNPRRRRRRPTVHRSNRGGTRIGTGSRQHYREKWAGRRRRRRSGRGRGEGKEGGGDKTTYKKTKKRKGNQRPTPDAKLRWISRL